MSLLCRISKHAKPNNIIPNLTRQYFQIHSPSLHNHTPLTPQFIPCYTNYYVSNFSKNQAINQRREGILTTRVRFFAAPVQFLNNNKKKEEVKELNRPRLNDEINVDFVRLVSDEGHSVVSRRDALQRAKDLDLDLVEVGRHANPPVCKLMDFKREQYKKQIKVKEKAKMKAAGSLKTGACKEVRFSTKSELKDLKTKVDLVKRLMERGYRVKCMALAVEDQDLTVLLSQVAALMEDVAYVECGPKFEKRQGFLIVRHIKFGPSKKGGGSKASERKSSSGIQKDIASSSESTVAKEEQQYGEESSLDNDDEDHGIDSENEFEGPLQGQEGTSWSKSSVSNNNQSTFNSSASSYDEQKRFDSSVTRNGASTFHPSQALDSVNSNASLPSQGLENRYARKVPINAPAMRDPMRSSHNRYNPQAQSPVRPPGGHRQGGNEGLPFRDFHPHGNEIPQPRGEIPYGARPYDRNFSPQPGRPTPPSFAGSNSPHRNDMPQPTGEMPDGARPYNRKSSGFGIFSGVKAETGVGVNQQTNGSPPTVPKNFAVPGNVNPPRSSSEDSAAGDGKKWGIFSGGSSNSGSKRNG